MSALRSSRSPADVSTLIAPFQSPATIARLPAAKSGSSAAQSAPSANDAIDEQIGQASGGITGSDASLLALSCAAVDLCGAYAIKAQTAEAPAKRPKTAAKRIKRIIVVG